MADSFTDTISRRRFLKQLSASGAAGMVLPFYGCGSDSNDSDGTTEESLVDSLSVGAIGPYQEGKTTFAAALSRIADELNAERSGSTTQSKAMTAAQIDNAQGDRLHGVTAEISWFDMPTGKIKMHYINCPGKLVFHKNHFIGQSLMDCGVFVIKRGAASNEPRRMGRLFKNARMMGIQKVIAVVNDYGDTAASNSALTEEIQSAADDAGYGAAIDVVVMNLLQASMAPTEEQIAKIREIILGFEDFSQERRMVSRRLDAMLMNIVGVQEIEGEKVLLGQIENGILNVGDTVELVGMNQRHRNRLVKSVEKFGQAIEQAFSGELVGVVLEDMDGITPRRGQCLVTPGNFEPSICLLGELVMAAEDAGAEKLFNRSQVKAYKHGGNITAQVHLPDGVTSANPGETIQGVQLKLENSAIHLVGDELVIARGAVGFGHLKVKELLY